MDNKTQEIISDLFKIDPDLKKYEKEIIIIINEYMMSKPDTKFDEEFAQRLKVEILQRAAEIKKTAPVKNQFIYKPSFLIKLIYSLAGAAAILLIILPVTLYYNRQNNGKITNGQKLTFDYRPGISSIAADRAFGQLGATGSQDQAKTMSSDIRGGAPSGIGGGGATSNAGVVQETAKLMPPLPETINYKYIYKGDEIKQDQGKMLVYKRVKTGLSSAGLTSLVTGLENDLVDLSKFSGAEISNINLNEEKEYGYMVALNFTDGIISIFPNWLKWPRPEINCRDEACFNNLRIKFADVPVDDALIAIADKFVKDYGIDMSVYKDPYVMDYWRREYLMSKNKADFYIPEEITVNYPLVINNETVYDESGNPSGLSVNINIHQNKVSSLTELKPQNYESSYYETVTDADKILGIARRGGFYGDFQSEGANKTVEIELGTPSLALMRYYSYNGETQNSDELYMPCYVFPINDISDKEIYFYKKNIVVPLAEDVVKEINTDFNPQPMPLLKSGTESSISPEANH